MGEEEKTPEWAAAWRPEPRWLNQLGNFHRRGQTFWVDELDYGVAVTKCGNGRGEFEWVVRFRFEHIDYSHPCGVESQVSQFIARAIAKKEPAAVSMPATDNVLFKDRPALAEFMTLVIDDEGNGREPSVLMVAITPTAVRVGLKDDQAGGWLWREADTFQKALTAIDNALQAGNVTWAVPGGRNGKRR